MKVNPYQKERVAKKQAWKNHIESWKMSESKASDFCKKNKLNYHQFKYWQQIFRKDQHSDTGSSSHSCEFIEITSLRHNAAAALRMEENALEQKTINQNKNVISGLRLQTPNGYHIDLHDSIDLGTLAILLATIKGI